MPDEILLDFFVKKWNEWLAASKVLDHIMAYLVISSSLLLSNLLFVMKCYLLSRIIFHTYHQNTCSSFHIEQNMGQKPTPE